MTTQVLTPLDLRYIDGDKWRLLRAFSARSTVLGGKITVPRDRVTDFNSIPRGLWSLLPPTEYGEAAVLHDELYRTGRFNNLPVSRGTADRVHREFVEWKGAPGWKVRAMYWGLRTGGWVAWRRYRHADR